MWLRIAGLLDWLCVNKRNRQRLPLSREIWRVDITLPAANTLLSVWHYERWPRRLPQRRGPRCNSWPAQPSWRTGSTAIITGLLCLYPQVVGAGPVMLVLHMALGLGLLFICAHIYLCTLGDTPGIFRGMIDGLSPPSQSSRRDRAA